jgi:DNA-binding response OmpR family regulator
MKTILLVEDSETLQLLHSLELSHEGYRVYTSTVAAGALDQIKRKKPHLVVVNVKPGKYQVSSFLSRLRRACRNTPLILCAPYPRFALPGEARPNEDYVVMSSDVSELKQKVKTALERNSRTRQKSTIKNTQALRYFLLQTVSCGCLVGLLFGAKYLRH